MRLHWVTAAALSATLAVGCGDRNNQNAQNANDPNAPATAAPADSSTPAGRDEVSPTRDGLRADTSDTRPPASAATQNRTGSDNPARDRREPGSSADRSTSRDLDNSRSTSRNTANTVAESRPDFHEVTVPSGTQLPLELITPLSSETATIETTVRARVRNGVLVNGYTAIPAGTILNGTVTDVAEAGRVKGRARLAFRFDEATIHGVREKLVTNPVIFEGEASKGEDATKIGAGAGIGAAIGGILGGGSGAAKGAAIGGAAGTGAVLATKGKQVTLAEGADLSAVLANPVTVRVPAR
jgi:hypothetical protein